MRQVAQNVPWVPEVFRGPLRDLPAEGRPMSASADCGEAARKPLGKSGLIYCSR